MKFPCRVDITMSSYHNIILFLRHSDHYISDGAADRKKWRRLGKILEYGVGGDLTFLSYNAFNGAKRFHIVTRSYAALFSIGVFVKLTTFSTAKKVKNEAKPMRDSESKLKIKIRIKVTSDTFQNFTYVSSHLRLKSFA